jgi:hypothetical protein
LETLKGSVKKEPLEPLSVGALIAESQKQVDIREDAAEKSEEIQSLIKVMQILAADGT